MACSPVAMVAKGQTDGSEPLSTRTRSGNTRMCLRVHDILYSCTFTHFTQIIHITFLRGTAKRYKMDIDALDQLLDAQEENKLEAIRALIKDIKETRKKNPEVRCLYLFLSEI